MKIKVLLLFSFVITSCCGPSDFPPQKEKTCHYLFKTKSDYSEYVLVNISKKEQIVGSFPYLAQKPFKLIDEYYMYDVPNSFYPNSAAYLSITIEDWNDTKRDDRAY